MDRNLPLFEAKIDSFEDGILAISLVDYPAVERDFVCFKAAKEIVRFAINEGEEHTISGVVMLADTPIYRRNGDYEYYISYSKDTIRIMSQKMLADGTFKNIDIQHDGKMIQGLTLREVYIKDATKGLNPNFISDIPDGSLMATYHVDDPALWEEIKTGNALNGFSLEGLFTIEKINDKDMNIFKKIAQNRMNFAEAVSDKGTIYWDGDLAEGVEIYIEDENGEKVAAADGEYAVEDRVIVVVDGKVSEIRENAPEEEVVVEAARERFNKIKALFEESYEEKITKIADAVRAKGFDAWIVEAADDYAIAEVWIDEKSDYVHYRFPVSWDELGNAIVGDPEEVKSEFVPVDEQPVVEDVVVVEAEENTPGEEKIIVEPEVRDEKAEQIANLQAEVNALKEGLANLQAIVNDYITKPAAEPIVEEFERAHETPKGLKVPKAAKLFSNYKG